jgi:hypothetical protein
LPTAGPDAHGCQEPSQASRALGILLSPFISMVGVPSYYIKTDVPRTGLQNAQYGVEYFAARDKYNAARANIALSRINEEAARFTAAAMDLSGGLLNVGASGFGNLNCFVAGTLVATPSGEVPIEELQLGDRVEAGNAQCTDERLPGGTLTIGLEVPDPQNPNHFFRMELARTRAWLDDHDMGDGKVSLSLDEVGAFSQARLTHVLPAPQEQPGKGCLVLMTVEHVASELLKLRLESGTEIEVTPLHPFFVEGHGWISARDLKAGLMLRSDYGAVRLESVESASSDQNVFNLEVGLEHTYRVSTDRIWVHNQSPALRGSPYHPDSVADRVRPPYRSNPAHDKTSPLFNPNKTPEPSDAASVYSSATRTGMGEWFGRGKDGWYRYFYDNNGAVHFSGIVEEHNVPIHLRRP